MGSKCLRQLDFSKPLPTVEDYFDLSDPKYITFLHPYAYDIELSRIATPLDLVHWVRHLLGKSWIGQYELYLFIETVCGIKGWKLD